MQAAMCESVAEYFGSRQFLWTLPQPRDVGGVKDRFWRGVGGAFDPALRLPGRSFGLNEWRDHTDLALLSVINLSSDQLRLFALLGMDADAVFDAMTATILYQDLLRSNLRVTDGTDTVQCIVPDLPSALALAAELQGCTVEQLPDHLIPELAQRRHGPPASGTALSAAERQRRSRAARRQRMQEGREHLKEQA